MHIKCVFGHTKRVVLACCERVITFVPEIIWRVTFAFSVCLHFVLLFVTQNKNSDFCAPLTSFDWNEVDPNLLGTSSIDTTCTIWGLEVMIIAFLHV